MDILVLSDSHGDEAAVRYAVTAHPSAAAVIHLGDGGAEALRFAEKDTRPWHIVRGNCDLCRELPTKTILSLGGVRLYLTHGFAEHVKFSLLTLSCAAKEADAKVALYGHTHLPATDFDGNLLLFNPGSLAAGSYGILTIENGGVYSKLYRIP